MWHWLLELVNKPVKTRNIALNSLYLDNWDEATQADFLGKAQSLLNNETLAIIIAHLSGNHFGKAGIETKDWEETLTERSLGAGNIEVQQELERLNVIFQERLKEQKEKDKNNS